MTMIDRLSRLRRQPCTGCQTNSPAPQGPAVVAVTRRQRLAAMGEAWIIAIARRSCVDMPFLIDSLPNEVLHALFIRPDEARHD